VSLCKSKSHATFPFPKWGEGELKAILEACTKGWFVAGLNYPDVINSGTEEEVTEKLRSEMDNIMRNESVPSFNKSKYESIVRGAKVERFDGTGIDKAPDLTIRKQEIHPGLVDTHFEALFIECKLIEKKKTPLLYIENGVNRFVVGDYAWSMSQALMLAFVRNGKGLPDGLMNIFKRNQRKPLVDDCMPISDICKLIFSTGAYEVYETSHARKWSHPRYGAAGNIDIYHLWLKV